MATERGAQVRPAPQPLIGWFLDIRITSVSAETGKSVPEIGRIRGRTLRLGMARFPFHRFSCRTPSRHGCVRALAPKCDLVHHRGPLPEQGEEPWARTQRWECRQLATNRARTLRPVTWPGCHGENGSSSGRSNAVGLSPRNEGASGASTTVLDTGLAGSRPRLSFMGGSFTKSMLAVIHIGPLAGRADGGVL